MSPESQRRPKVALLVKYYYPRPRISGIIGYITSLARYLVESVDLQVICFDVTRAGTSMMHPDGYRIHYVGRPFPIRAGARASSMDPDATVVVSGINDLRIAVPYLATLGARLRVRGPEILYQVTAVREQHPLGLRFALRRFGDVVCADERTASWLTEAVGQGPHVIPPGIDAASLSSFAAVPRRGPLRLGCVSHFTTVKGVDRVVTAFLALADELPDARFILAGTGELEQQVHRRCAGHPAIEVMGYLTEGARLEVMRSCDVMVLPLRTSVSVLGVSQTVLECMAMGVVVAGSDTPTIATAIRDGEDGVLFADDQQMLDRLRSLATDPGLRGRLAASAHERVSERFDVAVSARQLLKLLGVGV